MTIDTKETTTEAAALFAQELQTFEAGLGLLDKYDHKLLDTKGNTVREAVVIPKEDYLALIAQMSPAFGSDVFANPKDNSFDSAINQIYQTFGGEPCYPSIEEKAAMLLYLLVKNHSFTDGNKRIGAACFLHFLNRNHILYKNAFPLLDNTAVFLLTLLVACSKPNEKEVIKQVIVSLLNQGKK